jgi:hypothetical protein
VTAEVIIADLGQRGIRLTPAGDGIAVEPASRLTDADRQAIRAHKVELLTLLRVQAGANGGKGHDGACCRCGYRVYDAERVFCPACGAELAKAHSIARLDAERCNTGGADTKAGERADELPAAPQPNTPARVIVPDSRHPLIAPEVRAKIEAVEAEARRLGWPPELLWSSGFWDSPRGLTAVLDTADEIVEVTQDHIAILKIKRDLLRFRRHVA